MNPQSIRLVGDGLLQDLSFHYLSVNSWKYKSPFYKYWTLLSGLSIEGLF